MLKKNIRGRIRFGTVLSLIIALMFLVPSGIIFVEAADTIIVDDDGTGDYTSIQAAINNAAVGDNIVVKDGTYVEQLTVNVSSISIVAASGETPVIYVSSYNVGIDVTAPDVLISGFEIFGNSSTGGLYPAIRASSGCSGLTITTNEFKVFTGQRGSLAFQAMDTVTDVTFSQNNISNYERGVSLDGNSWAMIFGNHFIVVNISLHHVVTVAGMTKYFGSIQYAIDNANSESIVSVYPGLYFENVLIDKSFLTLNGARSYFNPVDSDRTGYESIIDGGTGSAISIASGISDVEIKGFTLTISSKSGVSNEAGVLIGTNACNITVRNNIIENITDGSGADTTQDETYGVMVYGRDVGGGQSNIIISDNLVQNVEEYGIAINDNTSNVAISGNLITKLIGSDHSSDPIWDPSWPSIVCSTVHLGGQVGPIKNINIDDNILNTNITGDGSSSAAGSGVSFAGVQEWLPPNRLWEGFEQIIITDNQIYGNTMGILSLTGKFNDMPAIHSNNLSNNSLYGINNTILNITFNATDNWWGNISGPYHPIENSNGTGTNISGNVTFWPWYEFDGHSIPPRVIYEVGHPNSEGGQFVKSSTPITITAYDNESGMKNLTYRVWNATHLWSEWYNYTDDFSLSGEGKHMVEYRAIDMAGTRKTGIKIHYVDDEDPWIEIQHPNGGEYIRGDLAIDWEAADQMPDQKQIKQSDFYPLSGDYPGHIQSFVPQHETLNAVDLLLHGDEAEVDVVIFGDITPVPIPIATTSKHLQDVGNEYYPEWITFPFDSGISLEIGKTYYIGVTQQILGNIGINWWYYNSTNKSDPYPHGHCWIKKVDTLESHSELDWTFKTNYWNEYVDITIQYSNTLPPVWSTIVQGEDNDGEFVWDTTPYPDGEAYLIRVIADDFMSNSGSDESDNPFTIDNEGPSVHNVIISDTTLGSTEYTKDGDRLEISATVLGEISNITADLSGFGKESFVEPHSLYQDTATWIVNSINCAPTDGEITVTVTARDPNGDVAQNSGSIIADNTPPTLEITRPLPGIYVMDGQRLLPYPYPVIIGQITIKANANDMGAGVEKVEIYQDGRLREICTEIPYEWVWDEASIGFYKIEAIAYDNVGFNATASVNDVFILNFDIWD